MKHSEVLSLEVRRKLITQFDRHTHILMKRLTGYALWTVLEAVTGCGRAWASEARISIYPHRELLLSDSDLRLRPKRPFPFCVSSLFADGRTHSESQLRSESLNTDSRFSSKLDQFDHQLSQIVNTITPWLKIVPLKLLLVWHSCSDDNLAIPKYQNICFRRYTSSTNDEVSSPNVLPRQSYPSLHVHVAAITTKIESRVKETVIPHSTASASRWEF